MPTRVIRTRGDIALLTKFLEGRKLPLSVTVQSGKKRSVEQNRLGRLWINEIAEQLGDRTAEEVRGFCKLTLGVPILRAENEVFREKYDRLLKPLSYEDKVELMQEPMDWPVTRLMNVSQHVRYLDAMQRYWSERGLELTEPDPMFARDVERAKRKQKETA